MLRVQTCSPERGNKSPWTHCLSFYQNTSDGDEEATFFIAKASLPCEDRSFLFALLTFALHWKRQEGSNSSDIFSNWAVCDAATTPLINSSFQKTHLGCFPASQSINGWRRVPSPSPTLHPAAIQNEKQQTRYGYKRAISALGSRTQNKAWTLCGAENEDV